MPKRVQRKAKANLHEMWMAEIREDAEKAFDGFLEKYGSKHDAACEILRKRRDELLSFYNLPAEHWRHLQIWLMNQCSQEQNGVGFANSAFN